MVYKFFDKKSNSNTNIIKKEKFIHLLETVFGVLI